MISLYILLNHYGCISCKTAIYITCNSFRSKDIIHLDKHNIPLLDELLVTNHTQAIYTLLVQLLLLKAYRSLVIIYAAGAASDIPTSCCFRNTLRCQAAIFLYIDKHSTNAVLLLIRDQSYAKLIEQALYRLLCL